MVRRTILSMLVGIAAAAVASPASAQSDVCYALHAELASLERSGGGVEAAFRQTLRELEQTRVMAQQMGCARGFLFFGPRGGPQCGPVMSRMRRLESNANRLQSQMQGGGGFDRRAAYERDQLRQALMRQGCSLTPPRREARSNSFRTLCVRTCDGFYFPVSYSVQRGQFEADDQVCQARYPDGGAELYVHGVPGQEADQAVSLGGERYADQSYAFAYRSSYNQACPAPLKAVENGVLDELSEAARRQQARSTMGREQAAGDMVAAAIPVPVRRPAPGGDPETRANLAGGFVPQIVRPAPKAPEPPPAMALGDGVRLVGPSYYYAVGRSVGAAGQGTGAPETRPLPKAPDPKREARLDTGGFALR